MDEAPLMQFTSHIDGKNAKVSIYSDRIEWGRTGLKVPGGAAGAVLTGGLTLMATSRRKDSNMIPIRQIQGVTTHKAGLSYTTVRVTTAGDAVAFRVTKREAEQVKSTILRLMNQPTQSVVLNQQSGGSIADELRKLSELRAAGVLTDAEFNAQKGRLLGS
jgi:Short C-terminal domain